MYNIVVYFFNNSFFSDDSSAVRENRILIAAILVTSAGIGVVCITVDHTSCIYTIVQYV